MEINRCFGCMEEIRGYSCPRCGYNPVSGGLEYALRPGTILNGKYLIGKVLGQGGFGITYIGWNLVLERKVAVKEFFPSGHVGRSSSSAAIQWYATEQARAAKSSGQEMFLREARKMNRVSQVPQVVQVLDLFQENNSAYIIMEFVEGETLKEHLKKTGPISWEDAKKIFLPVAEAMERVHKLGLVHRDLSPDNLMLQPDGDVKILDLGAAKDLNLNSGASSMQVAKGGFSPLEQYIQRGGSGPWTDVYAIAATMYYTLTGVLPPSAIDRMDRDTLNCDLPQLQKLPPNVLQALKNAMAIRAENRTQSMAAFTEELMNMQVPKPVPAPEPKQMPTPEPVGNPRGKVERKKKWLIPGLAAAAVAMLLFVLIGVISGKTSAGNPDPVTMQKKTTVSDIEETTALEIEETIALEITAETEPPKLLWTYNVLMDNDLDTFNLYGLEEMPVFGSDIQRFQIRSVTFLNSVREAPSDCWDVSEAQDGSVLAWVKENGTVSTLNSLVQFEAQKTGTGYDLYIAAESGINGRNCSGLFKAFSNVASISFNECFHTDEADNMNGMFYACKSLKSLDVSSLNTSNVTSMRLMFDDCKNLTSLDVRGFNTSKVKSMDRMFNSCESLTNLDVSSLDTSNVTSVGLMFGYCKNLTSLDVSNFDTSNVTNMGSMFDACENLTSLDVSGFDTSNVTIMNGMFYDCKSLKSLDISGFDTSNVTNMGWMFCDCKNLTSLDVSGFDTSNVTDMGRMFCGCKNRTSITGIENWDLSSVEEYESFMDDGRIINGRPWEELFR